MAERDLDEMIRRARSALVAVGITATKMHPRPGQAGRPDWQFDFSDGRTVLFEGKASPAGSRINPTDQQLAWMRRAAADQRTRCFVGYGEAGYEAMLGKLLVMAVG